MILYKTLIMIIGVIISTVFMILYKTRDVCFRNTPTVLVTDLCLPTLLKWQSLPGSTRTFRRTTRDNNTGSSEDSQQQAVYGAGWDKTLRGEATMDGLRRLFKTRRCCTPAVQFTTSSVRQGHGQGNPREMTASEWGRLISQLQDVQREAKLRARTSLCRRV